MRLDALTVHPAAGDAADSAVSNVAGSVWGRQDVAGKVGAVEILLGWLAWMLPLKALPSWLKVKVGDGKNVDNFRAILLFPACQKLLRDIRILLQPLVN